MLTLVKSPTIAVEYLITHTPEDVSKEKIRTMKEQIQILRENMILNIH